MKAPSPQMLIDSAQAMAPTLDARASANPRLNRLPDDTIADLQAGRFTRVLQPRRYGGYEMHPSVFAEIQMALARGDLSTAWVFGVYAGHAYHLAFFDDRCQSDVWGENPDARIASPYAPSGRATPCRDGYRVSGRWKFSSGSVHTDWIMLGAMTAEDSPRYLIVVVPRKDYEVVDLWNVVGLRGTGSNDIVIQDAFVPAYRTLEFPPSHRALWPGNEVNDALIYRIPQAQVFFRGLTTAAIGGLDAMLEKVVSFAKGKINARGASVPNDPDVQLAIGEAANALDEMKTIMFRNYDLMMDLAAKGALPSMEARIMMSYQANHVPEKVLDHARRLYEATGGLGVFETSGSFERIYRDLIAIRNHATSQWRGRARNLGAVMMGLPNTDPVFG